MIDDETFRSAGKLAIANVIRHGDTDIFPRPFENFAFYDKSNEVLDLLLEIKNNFFGYIKQYPPSHVNSLTPVSYHGFRWATQLDPIWNLFYLSMVLARSESLEQVRIPKEMMIVFSYRFMPNSDTGDLFDPDFGWRQFMEESIRISRDYNYVITCDISEFYPRIGHHRLENALIQATKDRQYSKIVERFLANFSNRRSFSLPIGGPASRILSETTINQIDQLLVGADIKFVRFADDFHLFSQTKEEAYKNIIFISEKLFQNQGLSLQKSKTRILSVSEFRSANSFIAETEDNEPEQEGESAAEEHMNARLLMRFSLRFDPYSPTADEDYEKLKTDIRKFDILGLLKREILKSRVHAALSRKIIAAIRYLDQQSKQDAIISMLENSDVLYPIFSSALIVIEQVFNDLDDSSKDIVLERIVKLAKSESHVFRIDVYLCFAIRIISKSRSDKYRNFLKQAYSYSESEIVRRDIILALAKFDDWYWLSDLSNKFRRLSDAEKRAFIVASYGLEDEGEHWRAHTKREWAPFELFISDWAKERRAQGNDSIPL